MTARIRRHAGIEGEELEDLLSMVKDRTYGQYAVIGKCRAKCCKSILEEAEKSGYLFWTQSKIL